MDWILLCLLWITLITTSAYNNGVNLHAFYDYPNERVQAHRVDYGPVHPDYSPYNERFQRSAHITNQRPVLRTNEIPSHQINERVTSKTRKVQKKEKIRVQSWVEDLAPRSENGSYEIIHSPIKYSISTKRGTLEEKSTDSVLFPGSALQFVTEIPQECEELGICDHVPNYPQELVDDLISKLGDKLDRFKVDELEEAEISERTGSNDVELCYYREQVVIPQIAKDKQGKWQLVMNSPRYPIHRYRTRICLSSNQQCKEEVIQFFSGYTSVCKQEWVERAIVGVDVDRKEVIYDLPVRIPSCCSCVAIHNQN